MSYIFDALQRLDEKNSQDGSTDKTSAIELLARAERQVAAERDSELHTQEQAGAETRQTEASASLREIVGAGGGNSLSTLAGASETEARKSMFGQFQAVPVSCSEDGSMAFLAEKDTPGSEAFRLLAVRVRDISRQRTLQKLLITSTVPQEGKSVISANLACALGRKGQQKVLLLEGDVRRPGASQLLGNTDLPGLCEYLRGERKLTESIYHLNGPEIWFLPAGKIAGGSLEMIQSNQLSGLLQELSSLFDWIVIDSPPILPLADTSIWVRLCDGILLVTRHGVTKKKKLKKGVEALDPKKLIGALLNSSSNAVDSDYYYYHSASESSTHTSLSAD